MIIRNFNAIMKSSSNYNIFKISLINFENIFDIISIIKCFK